MANCSGWWATSSYGHLALQAIAFLSAKYFLSIISIEVSYYTFFYSFSFFFFVDCVNLINKSICDRSKLQMSFSIGICVMYVHIACLKIKANSVCRQRLREKLEYTGPFIKSLTLLGAYLLENAVSVTARPYGKLIWIWKYLNCFGTFHCHSFSSELRSGACRIHYNIVVNW